MKLMKKQKRARLSSMGLLARALTIIALLPHPTQAMEPPTPSPSPVVVKRFDRQVDTGLNPAKMILGLHKRKGTLWSQVPKDVARLIARELRPLSVDCDPFQWNEKALLFAHYGGRVQALSISSPKQLPISMRKTIDCCCSNFPYLVSLRIPWCHLLIQGQPGLEDLVKSLPNLREFDCSGWYVRQDCTLDCDSWSSGNWCGAAQCNRNPWPRYLSLTDISPLSALQKLQSLSLRSNLDVKDFRPLETLPTLTFLDLSGNSLADLSALRGLTQLQTLKITRTNVADASPLEHLVSLRKLDLSGCPLVSVSPLAMLTNLKTLHIGGTKIYDIGELNRLKSLRHLDLGELDLSQGLIDHLLGQNPYLRLRHLGKQHEPNMQYILEEKYKKLKEELNPHLKVFKMYCELLESIKIPHRKYKDDKTHK